MDDLHHPLAGSDRLDHGGADRLLADPFGEAAHHVERDVGLEQSAPNLAHRGIDIGFRQRPAAGQPIQNAAKLFRQIVEQMRRPAALPHPEEQAKPASRRVLSPASSFETPLTRLLRIRYSKHVCARGRIALSGVNLRPPRPVGGSKRSIFPMNWGGLNASKGEKSRKVTRPNGGFVNREAPLAPCTGAYFYGQSPYAWFQQTTAVRSFRRPGFL